MKKIIAALLAAVALCNLCACDRKTGKEEIKIGLAAPDATHGWVAGVAYYAEKYCNSQGLTYQITTASDCDSMTEDIHTLIDGGADVLVLWPQWPGMEDAVASAIESGVPVVSFDVDIRTDGLYKITGNNYDMGYFCAQYITEKVGDRAHIAVLDVPSSGSVAQLRKEGFYDYLEEIGYDRSNIFEVKEDGFTREIGYRDMCAILQEHEKVDAVFSIDDENSIGIVQAIEESGRTDIRAVTGGGGMQEYFRMIADKKYASLGLASALYSPSMVEEAIRTALDIAQGRDCMKTVIMNTTIVTNKNVESYLDSENTVY